MNKTYIILSLLLAVIMFFTIKYVRQDAIADTLQVVEDQCNSPYPLMINGHTYLCEFRY